MAGDLPYRENVAAVVVDGSGRLLACERSDVRGAWQLPQGGVDAGEDPEAALKRELEEEIGTRDIEVLWRLSEPIRYEWPEKLHARGFRGQEQIYFLVRLLPGAKLDLTLHQQEFAAVEWTTREEFLKRLNGFKRGAYSQALALMHERFPELI